MSTIEKALKHPTRLLFIYFIIFTCTSFEWSLPSGYLFILFFAFAAAVVVFVVNAVVRVHMARSQRDKHTCVHVHFALLASIYFKWSVRSGFICRIPLAQFKETCLAADSRINGIFNVINTFIRQNRFHRSKQQFLCVPSLLASSTYLMKFTYS